MRSLESLGDIYKNQSDINLQSAMQKLLTGTAARSMGIFKVINGRLGDPEFFGDAKTLDLQVRKGSFHWRGRC